MNSLLSSSYVMDQMRFGAKLHREFDKIELRMPDGRTIEVPTSIFDGLIDVRRIAPEGKTGFYRLT